jgi:hypothetical protein
MVLNIFSILMSAILFMDASATNGQFDKQGLFVNPGAERQVSGTYECMKSIEAGAGLSLLLWDSLNVNFKPVSITIPERTKGMEKEMDTVVMDQVTDIRVFDPRVHGVGFPLTPKAVSLEPMGTDSSSVEEVTIKWVEEEKEDPYALDVAAWHEGITDGTKEELKHSIRAGIEFVRAGCLTYNEHLNLSAMTLTGIQIQIGKVLNTLKKLTKKAGLTWETWVEKHLPFIKERSRTRAMLLASRTDCHHPTYLALGSDRLDLLCSVTKEAWAKGEKDPIGSLLEKYGIPFTQDPDESLPEFKALADAALSCERLLKNNFIIDFTLVRDLTVIGVQFNQALITDLQKNQASGGNPKLYLENLLENEGKVPGPDDDEKRFIDFNTLSTRLVKTIDYIDKDESQLDKIDTDTFQRLFDKLQALKNKLEASISKAA